MCMNINESQGNDKLLPKNRFLVSSQKIIKGCTKANRIRIKAKQMMNLLKWTTF